MLEYRQIDFAGYIVSVLHGVLEMKFLRIYFVTTIGLLIILQIQRVIWITQKNDLTHTIGFYLTVINSVWWVVTVVAIVRLKREKLSATIPLSLAIYQAVSVLTAPFVIQLMESNQTFDMVHTVFLFLVDILFVLLYSLLLRRLGKVQ